VFADWLGSSSVRTTHGDRAAVDVDLLHVEAHVAHEAQDDGGEGLVDLDEVELVDADARLGQRLARGGRGTGEHDRRVRARDRGGEDPGARLQPELGAGLLVADRHERGAVDDARRVARRVHVVDALDPVVLLQRDGVEAAHLAHHLKRRLELRQPADRRAGADELVVVEHHVVVDVEHRDDRVGELPLRLRRRGALLRAGRVGVDVVARELLDGGDQVGADALRHE
jgi:hypothetical protein